MDDPAKEWGLPDWRDEGSYGETEAWDVMRWRWEFSRRREDLRSAFDKRADQTYRECVEMYSNPENFAVYGKYHEGYVLTPDQPRFTARGYLDDGFGYVGIPNPRISEQPIDVIFSLDGYAGGSVSVFRGVERDKNGARVDFSLEDNQAAATIDLTKPLAGQIDALQRMLEREQVKRFGKKFSAGSIKLNGSLTFAFSMPVSAARHGPR